jgi:transcriptional regulator with XRE-family HTH domain
MCCRPLKRAQREGAFVSSVVEMAETTGDRIRLLRGGLSQAEFASKLGVHKEVVGKYERGLNVPGGEALAHMREVLGVDINWLLTGEGQMRPGDAEAAPPPAPTSASVERDADLYGRVLEAISVVYKECGWQASLRQIGEKAAQIADDIAADGLAPEEKPPAVKAAAAMLRRQLREAAANPAAEIAAKHKA